MTTAPTFRVTVFGCIVRSIALYSHAATHLAHSVILQAVPSITYFIGTAISCGR